AQPSQIPPSPAQPSQIPPPGAPSSPSAPPPPFGTQPVQAKEEPEELSEDIIDQIALRVELVQLDQAMTDIRKKLEELGEKISKIEVTTEIENKIKNCKDEIKTIKAKREKLNLEKQSLPFEEDLIQKKEIKERLKKLNEAYRSKEVTESAFKKLRSEYENSINEIDIKNREFKAKIAIWLKKLKVDESQIKEKYELLKARYAAGELNQDKYEEKKNEIEKKLTRYNDVVKYLSGKI
ncbi:MAG: hypothetical protein ACFFD2_17940, partial [Promethearchaeota archaeon]